LRNAGRRCNITDIDPRLNYVVVIANVTRTVVVSYSRRHGISSDIVSVVLYFHVIVNDRISQDNVIVVVEMDIWRIDRLSYRYRIHVSLHSPDTRPATVNENGTCLHSSQFIQP
jgi:hypothetical protein